MPVVCEGFQESLDDWSLPRKPEGLQVEPQGLVNTKPLEGECAAARIHVISTTWNFLTSNTTMPPANQNVYTFKIVK